MCGRARCALGGDALRKRCKLTKADGSQSEAKWVGPEHRPSYNIAPTQQLPVMVCVPDGLNLRVMKWGFVPRWAKLEHPTKALINARAETLLEKPTFRAAAAQSLRCVVVTEGFYEWQVVGRERHPYFVHHRGGTKEEPPIMYMAGLFDIRGDEEPTCCIVTLHASHEFEAIHDRMPAILPTDDAVLRWLDPKISTEKAMESLSQCPLDWFRVGPAVGSVQIKSMECCEPLPTPKRSTLLTGWLAKGSAAKKDTSAVTRSSSDTEDCVVVEESSGFVSQQERSVVRVDGAEIAVLTDADDDDTDTDTGNHSHVCAAADVSLPLAPQSPSRSQARDAKRQESDSNQGCASPSKRTRPTTVPSPLRTTATFTTTQSSREGPWSCPDCTLVNAASARCCAVCGAPNLHLVSDVVTVDE